MHTIGKIHADFIKLKLKHRWIFHHEPIRAMKHSLSFNCLCWLHSTSPGVRFVSTDLHVPISETMNKSWPICRPFTWPISWQHPGCTNVTGPGFCCRCVSKIQDLQIKKKTKLEMDKLSRATKTKWIFQLPLSRYTLASRMSSPKCRAQNFRSASHWHFAAPSASSLLRKSCTTSAQDLNLPVQLGEMAWSFWVSGSGKLVSKLACRLSWWLISISLYKCGLVESTHYTTCLVV